MTGRRRALRCVVAALACMPMVAARAQGDGFGLAQLTQLLAQVKSGEATFTEKRTVSVLERTLDSSGRLSFEAPDTFVRETLKPRRERMAVVGNTVTLSLGERSRSMALDSVPEAGVIVEAIRGTLTGNRDALERHFKTSVSGNANAWSLELVPRDPRLREQVASVRVAGVRSLVNEVVVSMPDGDRSVMNIAPLPAPAPAPTPVPTPARGASAPGG